MISVNSCRDLVSFVTAGVDRMIWLPTFAVHVRKHWQLVSAIFSAYSLNQILFSVQYRMRTGPVLWPQRWVSA